MALEGEAAEWMLAFHDDDVVELNNFDKFMAALKKRFEDLLTERKARTQLKTTQGRQCVATCVQEFWSLACRLI